MLTSNNWLILSEDILKTVMTKLLWLPCMSSKRKTPVCHRTAISLNLNTKILELYSIIHVARFCRSFCLRTLPWHKDFEVISANLHRQARKPVLTFPTFFTILTNDFTALNSKNIIEWIFSRSPSQPQPPPQPILLEVVIHQRWEVNDMWVLMSRQIPKTKPPAKSG